MSARASFVGATAAVMAVTLSGGSAISAPHSTSARAGLPMPAGDYAIVGAKIYPSPTAPAIEDGVLVVHDGRIAAVGARSRVRLAASLRRIDARGTVLTAGFWNSHVHLIEPNLLEAQTRSAEVLDRTFAETLTRWGFTTVFDLSSQLENTETLRRRIEAGEVHGPSILTTGDGFFPKDGTPFYVKDFIAAHHFPNWEVASPQAATARAERQLGAGADGVKLFAAALLRSNGKIEVLLMQPDVAKALVDAAHANGKLAFAHVSDTASVELAIDSGVDVLAHTTTEDGGWSSELVARVRSHHMALIPTLALYEGEFAREGVPVEVAARQLDAAISEVRAYAGSGGDILFGTDVGFTDSFDTHSEFRLMARALDWRAVLASLTTAPARRFGAAAHKGRLAPGMDADLVLLGGDPASDPTAFADVHATIRMGQVIWINAAPRQKPQL